MTRAVTNRATPSPESAKRRIPSSLAGGPPLGGLRGRRGYVLTCAVAIVALMIMTAPGCVAAGWALDVLARGPKNVEVEASYYGLEGKSAAIIVAADDHTLYRHLDMPNLLAKAVGGQISDALPSTTLVDPRQIEKFTKDNPYWSTLPYGDLVQRFDVDRLIVIDVYEFSTHDPEHKHVWRGVMSANINVIERGSDNPDAVAYYNTVHAQHPNRPVPILDSDEATIRLGLVQVYARRVAWLFYEHKEVRQ